MPILLMKVYFCLSLTIELKKRSHSRRSALRLKYPFE